MRILLLQARKAKDPVRDEERASFADKAKLPIEAMICHDLLQGPPDMAALSNFDALMIGGSGDYDVSRCNLPHFEATLHFLRSLVVAGFPTFASCFGFQLMVQALGGEIIPDPARMEVGAFDVRLNAAGRDDEIFGVLPPQFAAQFGHKERAVRMPDSVVNLASSDLCPYQALRIPGQTNLGHPIPSRAFGGGKSLPLWPLFAHLWQSDERR